MHIKIKPTVVASSCGFDILGRPHSSSEVSRKVSNLLRSRYGKQEGIYVYWKEKRRAKWIDEQVNWKTGKVTTAAQLIPTHWRYKVWFIPYEVVGLLESDGKVVKQYKSHWSIESKTS